MKVKRPGVHDRRRCRAEDGFEPYAFPWGMKDIGPCKEESNRKGHGNWAHIGVAKGITFLEGWAGDLVGWLNMEIAGFHICIHTNTYIYIYGFYEVREDLPIPPDPPSASLALHLTGNGAECLLYQAPPGL